MNSQRFLAILQRLVPWSPLVWPVVFWVLARELAPRFPVHWNWDAFSYLDAMIKGDSFVPLGLGRTPFCWFNNFLAIIGGWTGGGDPFSVFRVQLRVTTFLQALALGAVGIVLARRLGLLAAHGALAVMVLNTDFITAHGGIWPENMSNVFLLVALAVLLVPGLKAWWRLGLGVVAACLMVLMKETGITYVPALFLLYLFGDPALGGRDWKALLLRGGIFGFVGGVLPLGLFHAFTWMIPGLAEAREALIADHFAMENTGLAYTGANLAALTGRFILATLLVVPLVVLLVRVVLRLRSGWRGSREYLAGVAVALGMLVVPMLFVATTGRLEIMSRYGTMLLPGLALLTALALVPPAAGRLSRPRWQWGIGALLVLMLLVKVEFVPAEDSEGDYVYTFTTSISPRLDFPHLLDHASRAREDGRRYRAMGELRGESLAIAVADDTWPAWFVAQHGGDGQAPWDILWPYYDYTKGMPLPPDWVARHHGEGRRLAVSWSTASRLGIHLDVLIADLSDHYTFGDQHPSGWWIGTPK